MPTTPPATPPRSPSTEVPSPSTAAPSPTGTALGAQLPVRPFRAAAGRTAWIVGASSGIGEALALALAERGARLLLSARRHAELARVAARCRALSATAELHVLDLCDPAALPAAVAKGVAHAGAIDLLVLAAGVSQRSLATDTTVEVDRRLMEVNYFGPLAVAKGVVPAMVARGQGRILVLSSLVGKFGTPLRSGYAASKHALHGFFDSLRAEVHRHGVGVSLCCPGYIQTEITMRSLTGDGSAYGKVDEALRRGMPVEECAEEILKQLARGKDEFCVGRGAEMYAALLQRLAPGVLRRLVRSHTVS
jgi:short-subunit dehydrogenase